MGVKRNNYVNKRWANLLDDVRMIKRDITKEELKELLYSPWLDHVLTPKSAKLARLALEVDLSYVDMGTKMKVHPSQVGSCFRSAVDYTVQFYAAVTKGFIIFEGVDHIYPAVDAPFEYAILCGMIKPTIFRGVSSVRQSSPCGIERKCTEKYGIYGAESLTTLSDYQAKRFALFVGRCMS